MTPLDLKHPIIVNGNKVTAVTIRRPIGEDMVTIGDDLAALTSYYAAQAPVIAAAKAYADAVEKGETPPDVEIGQMKPPGSAEYKAMIAIAASLTGLGETAGKLDAVDLTSIAVAALSLGE